MKRLPARPATLRPASLCLAVLLAPLGLAACQSSSSSTGAASSAVPASVPASPASGTPTAATTPLPTPSGALKKFATAKLPAQLGSYKGSIQQQGTGQLGMYTGATQDQMVMVTLVEGPNTSPIAAGLKGTTVDGHAVCGTQEGVVACVLPLDGGYIHLQGTNTDTAASLGKLANQLWDGLA